MSSVVVPLANVAVLFAIAFFMWRKEQGPLKLFFWPALLVKCAAGIGLGLVYKFYYSAGDTFVLFQRGSEIASLATNDWRSYVKFLWLDESTREPRSLFFSKILSLIILATRNNYWISSLYLSFAAFAASWNLSKKMCLLLPDSSFAASLAFLFFPSVVFWSSGIIKETLAMAALFYLASVFILCWKRKPVRWMDWLLVVITLWVLWKLKYYYMAIFFPLAVATLFTSFVTSRLDEKGSFVKEICVWLLVMIIPGMAIFFLHPNFYSGELLNVIVSNYHAFLKISDPENVIGYHDLQPTGQALLLNAPWALFSGLYRPFFFETSTVFQFMISMENLFMLVLSVAALLRVKNLARTTNRLLTMAVLFYVVFLCSFLALSTPNFGTLVRYRVGFYPFFVFLVLHGNPLAERIFSLVRQIRLVR